MGPFHHVKVGADSVTAWDIGAAVRRHWLLAVSGVLLSLAAAGLVAHQPGIYWSQANVQFLLPVTDGNPNSYQFSSNSLITLAGVVGKAVGGSGSGAAPTSDEVTLVGTGIRSGYSVRLPNSGGQWATNFDKAQLDVQAAGATPAEVTGTMERVISEIETELRTRQEEAGVRPSLMVTTTVSPPNIPIYQGRGSRIRAVGASLLIGLALTTITVVAVDRYPIRRARRQSASMSRSQPST